MAWKGIKHFYKYIRSNVNGDESFIFQPHITKHRLVDVNRNTYRRNYFFLKRNFLFIWLSNKFSYFSIGLARWVGRKKKGFRLSVRRYFPHQFWFDLGYEKGKQPLYNFSSSCSPLQCFSSSQKWLEVFSATLLAQPSCHPLYVRSKVNLISLWSRRNCQF